jgi:large subunit ribosomal protein L17
MRHQKAGRKFGRNPSQRKAMLRQQAISLILNERIMTTEAKAKELRSVVEKLVTIARDDSQHHRNLVMSRLDHEKSVTRLFDVVAPAVRRSSGWVHAHFQARHSTRRCRADGPDRVRRLATSCGSLEPSWLWDAGPDL